jgi:hypothetical protein
MLIFHIHAMIMNHLVYAGRYEGTYEAHPDMHTRPTRR